MARVRYVTSADAEGDTKELLASMEEQGNEVLNIYRALGNTQSLRNFMRFGSGLLLRGSLDPPLRELAILRVGQITGCAYEWAHHVPIAREAGVRDDQMAALADWRASPAFDERERAVIGYAEAAANIKVTDETFAAAREHLSDEQMVELTLVAGFWGLVARTLEALDVDIEPEYQQYAPA
jgi:AhpD family alkylhydroperoxidase